MLRVRDIMTREVLSLRSDATVHSAAWSLATQYIGGAPVRDKTGRLAGLLSKSDLVDSLRKSNEPECTRVEEVMTPVVWAVHPDDPALDAARLMVDKGIHRVVVLAGPGRLAGIVTTTDILRALVAGRDFGPRREITEQAQPVADDNDVA